MFSDYITFAKNTRKTADEPLIRLCMFVIFIQSFSRNEKKHNLFRFLNRIVHFLIIAVKTLCSWFDVIKGVPYLFFAIPFRFQLITLHFVPTFSLILHAYL